MSRSLRIVCVALTLLSLSPGALATSGQMPVPVARRPKLKVLDLTHSLAVEYAISPRGRAYLG